MNNPAGYRAPFGPTGEHPVDKALCRRLLDIALGNGGEYADLFFEYRVGGALSFADGIVKVASRGVTVGMGVRVLRQNATGYACTEELSFEALERAAKTASQIAMGGGGHEAVAFESHPMLNRYELETSSLDIPLLEKRALCERAAIAAHRFDPRIMAVECNFSEEVREILIATSTGTFARDVQPVFRIGVRALARDRKSSREGTSGGGGRCGWEYFLDKPPEWHGREAARHAVQFLDCREGPTGDVVVVLGSPDCGILFQQAVAYGLEADFVVDGRSAFRNSLGEDVASAFVTLVDAPSIPGARGSINIDDEGVVPHGTVLIGEGRLCGYLHDRRSARIFGVSPTGNGRRESFAAVPLPRCTNTVILPGPYDPEAIVRSVRRGILVKKLGGGQVDISNGDFIMSLSESYLIEGGKVTAPLAPQNILGNGLKTLRNITMLGSDTEISDGIWTAGKNAQSVPVSVGCPTMRIEELFVSA